LASHTGHHDAGPLVSILSLTRSEPHTPTLTTLAPSLATPSCITNAIATIHLAHSLR
ncbi:unnamed protein product, partial [Dovyalis caffra]